MAWIIFIIVVLIVYFSGMSLLRQWGIRKIFNKAAEVTDKLKKVQKNPIFKDDVDKNFSRWLEKSNPQTLFGRIVAHSAGNKKLFNELATKLLVACQTIDDVIKLDRGVSVGFNAGAYYGDNFSELDELKTKRENLIAVIDQSFVDIKKSLGENNL
jgi:hypothetical protein